MWQLHKKKFNFYLIEKINFRLIKIQNVKQKYLKYFEKNIFTIMG